MIMDEADRAAHQTLIERYLKRFNAFVEDHSISLIKVLDDCNSSTRSTESIIKNQKNNSTNKVNNEAFCNNNNNKDSQVNGSSILTAYGLSHNILDVTSDPVQITWGPLFVETLTYEDLITSSSSPVGSNPDVHKVMLVLCSITSQMREWREEGRKKFVTQFILYGDGIEDPLESSSGTSVTEGKGHITISSFLPLLYELSDFIQNCVLLISNCIKQLGALFKDSKPHVVCISGVYFPTVFMELAQLLALLVVLDEILASQTILQEHWTKYKRMIKSVRADSSTFGVDPNQLIALEKDLIVLDRDIMSAHLFRTVIDRVGGEIGKSLGKSTSILVEKFTHHLTNWSSTLERDLVEGVEELKPIAIAALYVFGATILSPNFDTKKLFTKVIWENMKKIPAIPIGGTVLWVPEVFLNSFPAVTNKLFDNKTLQLLTTARHAFLQQKVANLFKDVLSYHLNVGNWTLRLQEAFYSKDMSQIRLEDLSLRSNLLKQGLKFSQSLLQNFRLIINLHATLGRPVTKQTVSLLCQILELLKVVQSTFHRFNVQVCESASSIVQNVLHIALSNVFLLEKYFTSYLRADPKHPDDTRADTLSVLAILKNVLKGSPTKKRLLIAQIAYEWTTASSRLWREEDQTACGILAMALERITHMLELQEKIQETCNGEHLYWHRVILPAYFTCVYQNELEAVKLPLMFLALNDCLELIENKSPHKEDAKKNFVREIEGFFKVNLVDKLVLDIETDLRLMSHTHLNVAQSSRDSSTHSNNFRHGPNAVKEYKSFLQLPSLVFNRNKINLKFVTENYLTKTFYNLASVALHDWQSYATMRVLASDKYELQVLEDHLPGHTLEQGLDILEIVRNLGKFVVEFSYNLNNQVFIQVSSPNKHLDTVNIRHLANSMRTHGPGMTNTTVHFTYLFLRSKMHSFSQFLYDEQIKSRLAKEIRLFKQGKQQSAGQDGLLTPTGTSHQFNFRPSSSSATSPSSKDELTGSHKQSSFPYDRVLKFQRGIRKLGLSPDGLSPLDQFRVLITYIGNALGFVRLVRSGGLHFLATGCRFVPDLEDIPNFTEMTIEAHENMHIYEEVKKGSINLDSALKSLSSTVADGVDFLGLLANGFAGPCRDPKNVHLKNFYVIIPALTLSYVDHMRSCKEKLHKKSNSQSPIIFTDDGFPMGVAFLLKVLGQDHEFDSLQWFSGVTKRLNDERQRALQSIQESKKDEKLQQANTLTAKRLSESLHEFHLLRYNLSSARIFFQQEHSQQTESIQKA